MDEVDDVPSINVNSLTSHSLSTTTTSDISNSSRSISDAPSPMPSTPLSQPRKRKRLASSSEFNNKVAETFIAIDGIVANHVDPKAPDVIQKTLTAISGYMSVLSDDRKQNFCCKSDQFNL